MRALSPLSGSLGPFRGAGLGVVLNWWLGSSKVPSVPRDGEHWPGMVQLWMVDNTITRPIAALAIKIAFAFALSLHRAPPCKL